MISVDLRALVPLPALSGQELAGAQLTVGDVVRARVVEAGAQGRPVLMLGAATFAVDLPFAVTPDQSLEFTVLEVKPELRLAVSRPPASPSQLAGQAGETAPDLQLSPEGRMLSRVDGSLPPPAAPPRVAVPGAADEALMQDPGRLALALREAVDRSGMFYERHQAQWVNGQRSEASLRQEPQAGWLPPANIPGAESDLAARLAGVGLSGQALEMVRQQVEVFQQQAFAMRTDLAQGISLEWRTRVDEDAPERFSEDPERRWETTLSSEFGSLERIEARLSLQGDRLSITLHARPDALERLRDAAPALTQAMAAAGLEVRRMAFEAVSASPAGA
jgi:hypothetical protein